MQIARLTILRPIYTWLLIIGCLAGGFWGFSSVGRLEDPAFTIKTAIVTTPYPGATASEVAREVTEPLEAAIQQMDQLRRVTSLSQPGLSVLEVEIRDTFDGDELPAIWQRLRSVVDDARGALPNGVQPSRVNDDFGDVYGLYYAITAEGFSDAELHDIVGDLRRTLLRVDGVASISVAGLPEEAIYIEADPALSANLGIGPNAILEAITTANSVQQAGTVEDAERRLALRAPENADSADALGALTIGVQGQVVNLSDFARVERRAIDQPSVIIRQNGIPAVTLGISGLATDNIVEIGERVDQAFEEAQARIPLGVNIIPIYEQHVVVDAATSDFLESLGLSIGVVLLVLALFMGWRAAIAVGTALLLTVSGTLFFMGLFSLEMERISLGALIIAMGMLVDNAIVVAEGLQVQVRRGKQAVDAAAEVVTRTQLPLLGATIIGIMAFSGIGLSPDATGEFLFSLFAVIGISLLLSWLLAITVVPLIGHYLFRPSNPEEVDGGYDGALFRGYAWFLRGALRARWVVLLALIGITAASYAAFGYVKQGFFPNSNTPIFYVHYTLDQGAPIARTDQDLSVLESWLLDREEVEGVTAFVGSAASRFILTYEPDDPSPRYGHMLVRTSGVDVIPALRTALEAFAAETMPSGTLRVTRIVFGPGGGSPVEARFSGNDPAALRALGEQAAQIMTQQSDEITLTRINWRNPEMTVTPRFATDRARAAGVTREDVASALLFGTDGVEAGSFRDGDRSIPIIARFDPRAGLAIGDLPVVSQTTGSLLPLEQVIDGFELSVENTVIHRRDRAFTLTVQADIDPQATAADVQTAVQSAMEDMPLPDGYRLAWGGEYEGQQEANQSLGRQLPLSLLVMVLVSVLLFGAMRQPLIVWLIVPMAVNGATLALLGTGLPFTFTALLGLLSLSGMLIKNAIVLIDEIDLRKSDEGDLDTAIVTASVSRVRPVVLAAATTILGMVPLLSDAFFDSMAVTIMGGLAFASVLTLLAVPVLYRIIFAPEKATVARMQSTVPTEAGL